jgi:ubiquinone/menaquinone biosynthesis C-methylase UbiE
MNSISDSKKRFSNRVENYIKYRPGYPEEIINFLSKEINLTSSWKIADIGSGTGILSELFLKNKNAVLGVEPNAEMRNAGEQQLKRYINFRSINGSSEITTIESSSIDLITAGQAFHWFDIGKSKKEFSRILKENGCVLLIWNNRKIDTSLFLKDYEKLLINYSIDYKRVDHKNVNDEILNKFFKNYKLKIFQNYQVFNFEGLKGRLLSSSYAPMQDHPNYLFMINELEKIFHQNKINGKVKFEYDTELYYGVI